MEITTLGTGSGMPSLEHDCACVLVRTDTHCFLFDAGEGTVKNLLKIKIGMDEIDAVAISHYHPDHVSGIFLLLQMLYLKKRQKPLYLFLPEREDEFEGILQMFYTFPARFSFDLKILPMAEINKIFGQVSCQINDHLEGYSRIIKVHDLDNRQQAWSLKVSSPEGDFVYSSDIDTTDSIAEFCRGAHSILVDAGHPTAEQIWKLRELGIQRILLNHETSDETRAWLQKHPDPRFEEAISGKTYYI